MPSDDFKEQIREAFIANPRKLIDALGLEIDEHKSKQTYIWVFDGNETDASLHINPPQHAGLCKRWGDDWSGDCFGLVQRYHPQMGFNERLLYVAQVYGVPEPEYRKKRNGGKKAPVVSTQRYPVVDANGEVIAYHCRDNHEDGDKTIWWERPDGTRGIPKGKRIIDFPLYRMPQALAEPGRAVVICEGEKDADAASENGLLALGTYGADVIPEAAVLRQLGERTVYIWPDADGPGLKHGHALAAALYGLGNRVRLLVWDGAPKGAGAADWFEAGLTAEQVRQMAKDAPDWEPPIAQAVDAGAAGVPSPAARVSGAQPIVDIVGDMVQRVEGQRALPRKVYGLRTGFPTFDNHTLGLSRESLILVLGESHAGKSTVARQIVYATCEALMAEASPARLVFYAAEGGMDQFLSNYAAYQFGVPLKFFLPGGMESAGTHWQYKIDQAYERLQHLPLDICDGEDRFDAILWDIERRAADMEMVGVVIDNLQLMDWGGGNDYQKSKEAARKSMLLGRRLGVPIVMLSQVNMTRSEGWNARGGPDWYNAADMVLYIERGEGATKREERSLSNVTTLINPKVRHLIGCCRPIRLVGDQETHRLWEEAEGQPTSQHEAREWPNNA